MGTNVKLLKDRELWQKVNLLLIYVVVFTFPFPLTISLKVMGLWVLSSLVIFDWKRVRESRHKIYLVIVVLYYLLFVVGLLWTQDIDGGIHQLSMKIYLLIFPFLFASLDVIYKRHFDKILSWFVLGQVAALLILYIIATYSSFEIRDGRLYFDPRVYKNLSFIRTLIGGGNYFFYTKFSRFMHPLYASYQVVFALTVLVFLKRNSYGLEYGKITLWLTDNKVFYPVFVFLSLSVFILGSRTNMISLSLLLFFVVLFSSIRPMIVRLGLAVVVLGISVMIMIYNPRSSRLAQSVENYEQLTWTEKIKAFSRVYFWLSAYDIGKAHPIWGVGTGDLQWHLYRKYAKMNMVRYLEPSFNSHNEYLEHFGRLGLLGLGLLLAMMVYAIFVGLMHNRRVLLMFIIITAVNFMFEVLLNRVCGTAFFAFFLNFLLLLDFRDKKLPKLHI